MQFSSYIYFVMVLTVLRYGPNKRRFPYRVISDSDATAGIDAVFDDAILDPSRGFLTNNAFNAALVFAGTLAPQWFAELYI